MVNVDQGISLLSQGTGYGIIIGLGVLFAAVILAAVKIQKLYLMEDLGRSEMFMVANRSVGTGLTCSAVFSSWMWINETVFSSVVCYQYGLAAPMWFGTGLSFQIALMAVLSVLAKLRVPHAHTSLQIVRKRYGNVGHVVFAALNLINNIFGCSSMILAGSQLVVGITGMHLAAATTLIPLGGRSTPQDLITDTYLFDFPSCSVYSCRWLKGDLSDRLPTYYYRYPINYFFYPVRTYKRACWWVEWSLR